jgi:hypothetical protein
MVYTHTYIHIHTDSRYSRFAQVRCVSVLHLQSVWQWDGFLLCHQGEAQAAWCTWLYACVHICILLCSQNKTQAALCAWPYACVHVRILLCSQSKTQAALCSCPYTYMHSTLLSPGVYMERCTHGIAFYCALKSSCTWKRVYMHEHFYMHLWHSVPHMYDMRTCLKHMQPCVKHTQTCHKIWAWKHAPKYVVFHMKIIVLAERTLITIHLIQHIKKQYRSTFSHNGDFGSGPLCVLLPSLLSTHNMLKQNETSCNSWNFPFSVHTYITAETK